MCFFQGTFCLTAIHFWVAGIAGAIILIFWISHLVKKNTGAPKTQSEIQKPLPILGTVYDFPGTCPAKFIVDRVDPETRKVGGTLQIQLPVGAKMTDPVSENDHSDYTIVFDDNKGGGGIYEWRWGECAWPKELDSFEVIATNLIVLPG